MDNQFILTPYYMGRRAPGLDDLAGGDWIVNRRAEQWEAGELSPQEQYRRLGALLAPLRDAVAGAVQSGRRPISVAGDCMAPIGVLAGLQEAGISPTLLWFDAHGDFNTWETTPSGYIVGMPLAQIVGRGDQILLEATGLEPFPERQVILADARDLDPGEDEAVATSEVTHVERVADLLAAALPDGPLYVHVDTDILDPTVAPAMYFQSPGGPSPDMLRRVFQRLTDTGRVVAASMSTWAPEMDHDGRSRAASLGLLAGMVNTSI